MHVVHFPMSCYVDMHVAIDFPLLVKHSKVFCFCVKSKAMWGFTQVRACSIFIIIPSGVWSIMGEKKEKQMRGRRSLHILKAPPCTNQRCFCKLKGPSSICIQTFCNSNKNFSYFTLVKACSCGPSLIFWAYALESTTLRSGEAVSLRHYLFSLPFLGLGTPN
jgi:hypothetical protein